MFNYPIRICSPVNLSIAHMSSEIKLKGCSRFLITFLYVGLSTLGQKLMWIWEAQGTKETRKRSPRAGLQTHIRERNSVRM